MSCPLGEIRRKAYKTKKGTKVKSTCVPDKGAKGKTPESRKVLPKLKKRELSKYGYDLNKNINNRKTSLKKSVKNYGSLPVLRKLVVLRTYSKNEPKYYKKYDHDVKFIQELRKKEK